MKKLVLTGLLSLLVLTGCGKKETVVCTQSQKSIARTIDSTINVYLENSRFKGLDMEINFVLSDSMKDQKSSFVSEVERTYKTFETKYGVTPVTTETDNGAKVTINMTTEQAKKFSGSKNDKATRQDVIDIFGTQGFECK